MCFTLSLRSAPNVSRGKTDLLRRFSAGLETLFHPIVETTAAAILALCQLNVKHLARPSIAKTKAGWGGGGGGSMSLSLFGSAPLQRKLSMSTPPTSSPPPNPEKEKKKERKQKQNKNCVLRSLSGSRTHQQHHSMSIPNKALHSA